MYGISAFVLTLCLLSSMFMYVALLTSCSREECNAGNDEALKAFNKIALPCLLMDMLMIIVGVITFSWGMADLARVRLPTWGVSAEFTETFMYISLIPTCFVGMCLSVLAFIASAKAKTERLRKVDQQKAMKLEHSSLVKQFLNDLDARQCIELMEAFQANHIDDAAFALMTKDDVFRLGLPMGDCLKIWAAITHQRASGSFENVVLQ
eukprot:gnl/MRDRNA2_/MRDRNA2_208958_c0_seq1.p2 gnl/MRDRNA2_/MRDRNA2_208958_c0~~gnl/MRDRNA2_/MRDRNA2_208958_c0_seq1.p2  ORF type:complete len:208 (-),score=42.02 gnl/MRDRNA2_/MRDRNA2_208958_c0_seq1:436-1059(-)